MDSNEQTRFFYSLFNASLPRLGPGDDLSTKKALDILLSARTGWPDAPDSDKLRVLDIGCGNGAQTIQLAKHIDGTILAVDNHKPYLNELQHRAEVEGVSEKIRVCLRDMRDLGAHDSSFDIVWSEGALYIMGFRDGLVACRSLLASGGLMAVSELCWLLPDPPDECLQYFAAEYPAMADVGENLSTIEDCGYRVVGHFTLPESSWWEPYYDPLQERLQLVRQAHLAEADKIAMIDSVQTEIDLFRRYSRFYGYVFYILKR